MATVASCFILDGKMTRRNNSRVGRSEGKRDAFLNSDAASRHSEFCRSQSAQGMVADSQDEPTRRPLNIKYAKAQREGEPILTAGHRHGRERVKAIPPKSFEAVCQRAAFAEPADDVPQSGLVEVRRLLQH